MRPEILIRNWLLSWFKPDFVTDYNISKKRPLTDKNFSAFIGMFKDEFGGQQFTDDEKKTLKEIILKPLIFGTGYPINEKEAIKTGTIYFVGAGWQQTSSYLGDNYWEGRSGTHIAIVGTTAGSPLNMAETSLLLQVVTALLLSGRNYFTSFHMSNPMITETLYAQDESNSMEKGFSIRTLTLTYDSKRHGVITDG